MTWLCVTPEKQAKSLRIMSSLAKGWPDSKIAHGPPPEDGEPFFIYGQIFMTLSLLPRALSQKREFWHVDNGYWDSAKGTDTGYYRICHNGMIPVSWPEAPLSRIKVDMAPWRSAGDHILLALPSGYFGTAVGIDHTDWLATIKDKLKKVTGRKIIAREKGSPIPLKEHLRNCWAVVTHSSNVAVDAVLAGIPAFVEPSAPTVMLGNWSISDIENPELRDRTAWWNSLMAQQFTLDEMVNGTAYRLLSEVKRAHDHGVT